MAQITSNFTDTKSPKEHFTFQTFWLTPEGERENGNESSWRTGQAEVKQHLTQSGGESTRVRCVVILRVEAQWVWLTISFSFMKNSLLIFPSQLTSMVTSNLPINLMGQADFQNRIRHWYILNRKKSMTNAFLFKIQGSFLKLLNSSINFAFGL